MSNPSVTVIIPTHNREQHIAQAIHSALNQCYPDLEIIVVDDASTDQTAATVSPFLSTGLKYVRLETNVGGGGARNAGLDIATGDFVLFLDSDDEWLENHVRESVGTMLAEGVDGTFSSFFIDRGGSRTAFRCRQIEHGQSMVDYILGAGGGDPRSSTMAFRRSSLLSVRFDDTLRKQQDWDLAIRFSRRFPLAARPTASAVIHVASRDRMSANSNPEATQVFLDRYLSEASPSTVARVYTRLMLRNLRERGTSGWFRHYRQKAWSSFSGASGRTKAELILLSWAPLGRGIVSAREMMRAGRARVRRG